MQHSFSVFLRRRRLVGVITVVVTSAALAVGLLQHPIFTARAEVVFQPARSDPLSATTSAGRVDPLRDIQTEIELITSGGIREMAAARLRMSNPPPVSASPALAADAITVATKASDPRRSAQLANAYARAYVQFKDSQAADAFRQASRVLAERISELQRQIDAMDAQIAAAPGPEQGTRASRDALVVQQGLLKQQLDRAQLRADISTSGAFLATPAPVPTAPSSPRPLRNALLGCAFGLFVGIGLAFFVEALDDSVRSREGAELLTPGVPTLGVIPWAGDGRAGADAAAPISLTAPDSAAAEAYRSLRTAIEFMALDGPPRSLLVTSPGSGDGKTTTLVNLAILLADTGQRVCVVSADLRRAPAEALLGVSHQGGLTEVLSGSAPLSAAIQPVAKGGNLFVLPAGPPAADPAALLATGRAEGVLASIRSQFDLVLVDSPPILPVADACILASRVDGVIMVVRAGQTKKGALVRATECLRQVEAPLLGLVVNGASGDNHHGGAPSGYQRDVDGQGRPSRQSRPAGETAGGEGLARASSARQNSR